MAIRCSYSIRPDHEFRQTCCFAHAGREGRPALSAGDFQKGIHEFQGTNTNSTWIARTRQRWKAYLGFACILGSGVFFVQMILGVKRGGPADAEVRQTVAFVAVGMCGVVWLATS
jgi:hypothetical protein